MSATEEIDHIDRYFSKNWMEEDFPTDEIYAALAELDALKQELREQKPITNLFKDENTGLYYECDSNKGIKVYADPMPAREGWKLVPSIPTEEMQAAAEKAGYWANTEAVWVIDPFDSYKAMLEAAPKEPS